MNHKKTLLIAAIVSLGSIALPSVAIAKDTPNTNTLTQYGSNDGIIAKVNDQIILKSELNDATYDIINQYQAHDLSITPAQAQRQALDELIVRKVQLGMINRAGFTVSDEAINHQLMQIAQSQGLNSIAQLQQSMETQQKGSYNALRQRINEDAGISALWQHQASSRIKISDDAVTSFLKSPEAAKIPKQVIAPEWKTSHILVQGDTAAAKQKIDALYDELRKGADFKTLAAYHSDDLGSAVNHGNLGWVKEGQMVPEFEAMMKRTEAGDYSAPFRSQFGWHILKVDQTREQDISKQYRDNAAREILFSRLAPQVQEDWLNELRSDAYVEIIN
ncbi:peptidylprolyl isomerase [Moraxella nasovis]|uniref:peptidylprolyl isomerase n=1 Tax=Moraxella nasovis TaxID=2904121 RepID=UPI001F6244C6|nr:peptidylprolyl isomerase [Moraxella nasovis]UNU73070.1 peptidylprolyl isomerase [Moraxella nasovis]